MRGREGRLDDVIGLPGRWALLGRILEAVIYQLRYGQRALLWHLHANFLGTPQLLLMHIHVAHVILVQWEQGNALTRQLDSSMALHVSLSVHPKQKPSHKYSMRNSRMLSISIRLKIQSWGTL